MRGGLDEAEFPKKNVSSLTYTVKTAKRKIKELSLDRELQKAGIRMKSQEYIEHCPKGEKSFFLQKNSEL